jgi:hypothetical protein
MLPTIVRIFVSSTWLDLQPERQAVEDAINRMSAGKFIGMEYFGSRPENTERASIDEVDRADIYVGIIGGRYGSGITEKEYRRARERELPCFIYFKEDRVETVEGRDNDVEKAARLDAFKRELCKNHIIATPFTTPAELAIRIRDDLYRWFDQHRAAELARGAVGDIVTTRGDKPPARLQVGAAEGVLLYDGAAIQPRPLPTPRQPSVRRPFPELLDRGAESEAAIQTLSELAPVEFYGQAGIGKTALLRHLAYHIPEGHFPDGVVYRGQVGQQPAADLLQFLFDSFYESERNYKPREAELLNLLRDKRALVLLDDVEMPREEIERALNAAPDCAFLLSAEERHLVGEGRALRLIGLPAPEAAQLLKRELGRLLEPDEQAAVQTICALLEGHPLHIAQAAAAAQEGNLPLGELAQKMQAAQAEGRHPADLFNRQVAAAVTDDEKRALAVLAALDGAPVRAEILAAIFGASNLEAILERLSQRKLVEAREDGYRLTGPLQDTLQKDWDLAEWRDRALTVLTAWVEAQQRDPRRIEETSAALLAIFNWATKNGRGDEAKRLGKALNGALILSGRWEAWGQVLQQTGEAAAAIGDEETAAWVLHQQGSRALCLGDDETALRSLTEALERRAAMGDHAGASATRHNLDWRFPPVPYTMPELTGQSGSTTGSGRGNPGAIPGWLKFVGAALMAGLGGWIFWPEAKPRFSPEQLSFPNQPLNQASAQQTVTLTNPGKQELVIDEARIDGPAAGDFAIVSDGCRGQSLARGAECIVSLVFTPREAGARKASLKLIGRPGDLLPALEISGMAASTPTPTVTPTVTPIGAPAPNPRLEVNRTEMAFGPRQIQTSGNDSLTLTNRGAADLTISDATINGPQRGDFSAAYGCAQRTLRPNGSCAINITFTPSAEGERVATLIIISNDANSPLSVPLKGRGNPPPPEPPEIKPNPLNFGRVELGKNAVQSVTLINNGAAPLKIGAAFLKGGQLNDFKLEQNGCQERVLSRGDQCTIRVVFTPQAIGARSATLVIADNTPSREQNVGLNGVGLKPAISRANVRPSRLAFSDQEIGGKGEEKTITVTSVGDAPLQIFSVNLQETSIFRVTGDSCSKGIFTPRQTCGVTVLFAPRISGAHRATLLIESNAVESPHRIEVSGRVNAPIRRLKLTISPASHYFGSVTEGDKSKALNVSLRNDGDAALKIGEINVGGADPNDFNLSQACANSEIQPGRECRFKVSFTPQAFAGRANRDRSCSASLFISHNADGGRNEVRLTGNAARSRPRIKFDLTPSAWDFGRWQVGARSQAQSFRLTNQGDAPFSGVRVIITEGLIGSLLGELAGKGTTVQLSDNFKIEDNRCKEPLNPRGDCEIVIRFTPRSARRLSGTLQVSVGGVSARASLNGEGVGEQPPSRRGWCCINGRIEDLDPRECGRREGRSYPDEVSARRNCYVIR